MDLDTDGEEKRELQETTKTIADEAYSNHLTILRLKYSINKDLFKLAIFLKESRDKKYYKIMNYADTWEGYLATPEINISRGYAHKLITNYEIWVLKWKFRMRDIDNIDAEKLYLAGMVATKKDYEEWLERAKVLSRSDIRGLIKGEEYEYWIKCPKCGFKFQP